MPTRIIESGTAGPAYSAATCPVITKIPAPMTAPMPSVTRLRGPSARTSACSPVASASARSTAMGLVANSDIPQSGDRRFRPTAMWDGRDSGRYERDLGARDRSSPTWSPRRSAPHPLSPSPCGRGGTMDDAVLLDSPPPCRIVRPNAEPEGIQHVIPDGSETCLILGPEIECDEALDAIDPRQAHPRAALPMLSRVDHP